MVLLNDGTMAFAAGTDPTKHMLGSCSISYRNTETPAYLKVSYKDNTLSVSIFCLFCHSLPLLLLLLPPSPLASFFVHDADLPLIEHSFRFPWIMDLAPKIIAFASKNQASNCPQATISVYL